MKEIYLDNCNLGSTGAISMANAIQVNKYLTVVSLRNN